MDENNGTMVSSKEIPQKVYPLPTKDDFYFEDKDEEAMGIETKLYDNKRKVKRIVLTDGRVALVRTLKGYDVEQATRMHEGDKSKYIPSRIAIATTIDGEAKIMEDILELDAPDYDKIRMANLLLNF